MMFFLRYLFSKECKVSVFCWLLVLALFKCINCSENTIFIVVSVKLIQQQRQSSWLPLLLRAKLRENGYYLAQEKQASKEGLAPTTIAMIIARGRKVNRRRQVAEETTTTKVMTMVTTTCHCLCDHDHYYMEEEERLTTTGDMTGQGEGTTTTTRTRKTAMTTMMQNRLQERYRRRKRTTTASEGIIGLLTYFRRCLSHGIRAGQTTMTAAGRSNGGNYNSGGSTTAENPTTLAAAIDSTTTAIAIQSKLYEHYDHTTPLFTVDTTTSDTVVLINRLPCACSHYLCILHLLQARLPQPTVLGGTTPPFHEGTQETRNFLSINNYDFIQQLDYALQSDQEITLDEVASTTEVGAARTTDIVANTETLVTLQTERTTPEAERPPDRDK